MTKLDFSLRRKAASSLLDKAPLMMREQDKKKENIFEHCAVVNISASVRECKPKGSPL